MKQYSDISEKFGRKVEETVADEINSAVVQAKATVAEALLLNAVQSTSGDRKRKVDNTFQDMAAAQVGVGMIHPVIWDAATSVSRKG